jgi:hypothetical protein
MGIDNEKVDMLSTIRREKKVDNEQIKSMQRKYHMYMTIPILSVGLSFIRVVNTENVLHVE